MATGSDRKSADTFLSRSAIYLSDWCNFLKEHNIEASMSRRGNCHDNAIAERFLSLLYIGSESTFYRVLKANGQLNRRGRSQRITKRSKSDAYVADAPNKVWSWGSTYLASVIKGQFYYLYMFEDIYSRKIVGYEVHEQECGELAAELMQRSMLREQCFNKPLILHSDNGAPMKSLTMKAKLEEARCYHLA